MNIRQTLTSTRKIDEMCNSVSRLNSAIVSRKESPHKNAVAEQDAY